MAKPSRPAAVFLLEVFLLMWGVHVAISQWVSAFVPPCRAPAINSWIRWTARVCYQLHLLEERRAVQCFDACGVTQQPRRREAAYDSGL